MKAKRPPIEPHEAAYRRRFGEQAGSRKETALTHIALSDARRAVIHTDGSCAGNPGPGGWAAVIRFAGAEAEQEPIVLTGGVAHSTNNRMELTAAIEALKALPSGAATLFTDSQYLVRGMTEWLRPWKSHGWKNAAGAKVRNRDLWKELDLLTTGRDIAWVWIKGHDGHAGNEEVDRLAGEAARRALALSAKPPRRIKTR
ncbi:ribonuclease HI [Aureimonas ureilytica]|uniref:ribonuclease HI n=1 Tax=Aureimonas ureilytica TaxID=401562 RepID=UPI0009E7428E|nr:ribonuclease HI [Aureimonas ureilytica]